MRHAIKAVDVRDQAIIDLARDLAWRGHANRSGMALADRNETVQALRDAIRARPHCYVPPLPYHAQFRALMLAIWRIAGCSWANRRGEPYYIRRQALAELRGCLESYDSARRDSRLVFGRDRVSPAEAATAPAWAPDTEATREARYRAGLEAFRRSLARER